MEPLAEQGLMLGQGTTCDIVLRRPLEGKTHRMQQIQHHHKGLMLDWAVSLNPF